MQFTRSARRPATGRPDGDGIRPAPASADQDWLGELFRLESPWLTRFFRRRLGSGHDAEDLTQETFMRVARALPTAAIETPQAYLRTIATNLLRDRAAHSATRWARVQVPLDEGLDCPDEIGPDRALESRQELEIMEGLLRQLKPRTREIFLLSRVDGYRYAEIAQRLQISVWSVKREMMKAIAHIDQAQEDRR